MEVVANVNAQERSRYISQVSDKGEDSDAEEPDRSHKHVPSWSLNFLEAMEKQLSTEKNRAGMFEKLYIALQDEIRSRNSKGSGKGDEPGIED